MYGDHMAGKIDPATRVAGRQVTAGFDQDGVSRTGSGAGARLKAREDGADGTSSKRDRSHSKENRSQASRSQKVASKMSERSKATNQSDKLSLKYDISP